jgi:Ca2+-binding EF-hand superfamily protein
VEELREAYTLFDESGDCKISVKKIKIILRTLGLNPRDVEMMKGISPDSDG